MLILLTSSTLVKHNHNFSQKVENHGMGWIQEPLFVTGKYTTWTIHANDKQVSRDNQVKEHFPLVILHIYSVHPKLAQLSKL